jgi:polysaccharide deacetylase 2 family uncharacterized protein YibQ
MASTKKTAKSRGPKGRRPVARRRRRVFPAVALIISIPLVAALLFFGRDYFAEATRLFKSKQVETPEARPPGLVEQVRKSSEFAREHRDGSEVRMESVGSLETVSSAISANVRGAEVRRVDDALIVTREGEKDSVVIREFRTADSGAGLTEAEGDEEEATPATRQKRITLILDDVGFENQPLEQAAEIDPNLNFAILPLVSRSKDAAQFLHDHGFEVLCHLPMEPLDGRDKPGPGAILGSMTDEEIRDQTLKSLESVPHAIGVNNHMGSRATSDRRVMTAVLEALPPGSLFVDSRTSPRSIALEIAKELRIRTAARDVFLDDVPSEAAVRRQLNELAEMAESHGHAIGIGHMHPVTIRVLAAELPRLRREGFIFTRVSDAAK